MILFGQSAALRPFRRLLVAALLVVLPQLTLAAPRLIFSDLESGPNTGGENNKGVYVTIWGNGFGTTTGTVTVGGAQADNYPLWSDTKITFQLGNAALTGNIVVRTVTAETSNGVPFTVRPGRIFFVTPNGTGNGTSVATPMSPSAAYNAIRPGDTFYLRAGNYPGMYGGNWGARNFAFGNAQSGTPGNPVAFVGYPNALASIITPNSTSGGNIVFLDNGGNSDQAHYMTFANLTFVGGAGNVSGGGWWQDDNSGATNERFVGNVFSALYCAACNTMTGLISIEGAGWRVLGNEFKDTGGAPSINNNHAVYINTGADDAEIGWNYFHDLHIGHVIQVHTDTTPAGTKHLFQNIRIHDNVLTAADPAYMRGINAGNMQPGSSGTIYNNILYNVGQDFSGIAVYNGNWKIYNNTLYNVHATAASHSGMIMITNQANGGPVVEIVNNILYSDGVSPYITISDSALWGSPSQVTAWSNNLYFNFGAAPGGDAAPVSGDPLFVNTAGGNFRIQSNSPAVDAGSSSVNTVVSKDHDGASRPQGAGYDIGAYEVSGSSLPRPTNLMIQMQ